MTSWDQVLWTFSSACSPELRESAESVFSILLFSRGLQITQASGAVLGTVLVHVPASVAVDFEAVQFSSTMLLSCLYFSEFEAKYVFLLPFGMGSSSTRPCISLTSSVSYAGARHHRVHLLAHAELCNRPWPPWGSRGDGNVVSSLCA